MSVHRIPTDPEKREEWFAEQADNRERLALHTAVRRLQRDHDTWLQALRAKWKASGDKWLRQLSI